MNTEDELFVRMKYGIDLTISKYNAENKIYDAEIRFTKTPPLEFFQLCGYVTEEPGGAIVFRKTLMKRFSYYPSVVYREIMSNLISYEKYKDVRN